MPAAHPCTPILHSPPLSISFLRLFTLRIFQSFAVLWTSFLKQDALWHHLPRLGFDTAFNTAQNGNCLLAATHMHREIRRRERMSMEKEGEETTRMQKTDKCHPV